MRRLTDRECCSIIGSMLMVIGFVVISQLNSVISTFGEVINDLAIGACVLYIGTGGFLILWGFKPKGD